MQSIYDAVTSQINNQAMSAQAMSAMIASQPSIKEAFARGDRELLSKQLLPVFYTLSEQYGVEQFQFHTAPATSFLRLHDPKKYGDDLSSKRSTIVEVNRKRQPVNGVEEGVSGLGIRGLVPVNADGQHVGSIEFGIDLSQNFVEQFSAAYARASTARRRSVSADRIAKRAKSRSSEALALAAASAEAIIPRIGCSCFGCLGFAGAEAMTTFLALWSAP
mgnify:CR=1 FL=1